MNQKYKVYIDDPMHRQGEELLAQKCEIVHGRGFSEAEVMRQTGDVDGMVMVRSGMATRAILDNARRLKVIVKHGVGVDKIDLNAAHEKGVKVIYTPGLNSISVAEQFVTLALSLLKKMNIGNMAVRKGKWKKEISEFLGIELHGKTLGVLGMGKIGWETARICHHGFDMPVLYYDVVRSPKAEEALGARLMTIEALFAEADIISINIPLDAGTRGLVDGRLLRLMKPSGYVINMARGEVWREKDVVKALEERWIAGAGSDVYEKEPTDPDNPLFKFPNFVGTPHLAAHTEENLARTSVAVAEDLIAVLEGREPKFPSPRR
jgi:D-3-phosphoglycerate dehydrogenase / 2-oxoglutarate reductase